MTLNSNSFDNSVTHPATVLEFFALSGEILPVFLSAVLSTIFSPIATAAFLISFFFFDTVLNASVVNVLSDQEALDHIC